MLIRNGRAQAAVLTAAAFVLSVSGIPARAHAQTTASVAVAAGTSLATIPAGGVGLNTGVWDTNLMDGNVPALAQKAGITALRYPGGSTADMYDWQSNAIVPGQSSYADPNNNFDAFIALARSTGAMPIVTIDYGTNAAGTGGNTGDTAAAWVAYANTTKGYGVKYWEIGNEVYGNGEYGAAWETDMHSAHDPTTYGQNIHDFIGAMKAADPSIKIGAVLAAPGNWPDGQTPDWNSNVLAQCGASIDFVIIHWYPQNPGNESDAGLLAGPQNGIGGSPGIAAMVAKVRALINQYGGSNAPNVQIFVTETNSVASNPGKQTLSIVNAMFLADGVMTWLENGVSNVDVWALHDTPAYGNSSSNLYGTTNYGDYGVVSSGIGSEPAVDTPFPSYYALQMLANVGHSGDALVSAESSNSLVSAHAVKQANGNLAVLLINKDPSNTTTTTVSVAGYTPASAATIYRYGATSKAISATGVTGVSGSFPISLAPYSLTTVVMTPASGSGSASGSTSSSGSGSTGSGSTGSGSSGSGSTGSGSTGSGSTGSGSTGSGSSGSGSAGSGSAGSGSAGSGSSGSGTPTPKPSPSFTISDSPASLSLVQGKSGSATIALTPSGGFTGAVAYTISGLPSGVSASFGSPSSSGATMVTLTANGSAAIGSGTMTITGSSGSLHAATTLGLTVAAAPPPPPPPPPPPSFTIAESATSMTVQQGHSVTSTVTIKPMNGFANSVTLSASNLPAGVTASFSQPTTMSGSTLTLTAGSSAPVFAGGYVVVTATSGSLTQTLTVPVSVTAAPATGGSSAGPAIFVGKSAISGDWFDEDDVLLTTLTPITQMTLTITVPSANVSYNGSYNTTGAPFSMTGSSGSSLVYTFKLPNGYIYPGSYLFAAQMGGDGKPHLASGDQWTVTYTSGGHSYTQSGVF